jgi:hypothetical protein
MGETPMRLRKVTLRKVKGLKRLDAVLSCSSFELSFASSLVLALFDIYFSSESFESKE